MTDYRVNLDVYHGPMDLLIYLVRKEELDIHSVPISKITGQYVRYVELLTELDPNISGEFLVLAATLMEIKTRALLPAREGAEDGDEDTLIDPRVDLVKQLLQYKQFKDAAEELDEFARNQSRQFPRSPSEMKFDDEFDLEEVQVWDLFEAFTEVMDAIGKLPDQTEIIYDDTPIELLQEDILDRLRRFGATPFRALFEGRGSRSAICGVFLAVLELMRGRRILATKGEGVADINLELNPDPPEEKMGGQGD